MSGVVVGCSAAFVEFCMTSMGEPTYLSTDRLNTERTAIEHLYLNINGSVDVTTAAIDR